ncbi:MAG: hypothetical protein ACI9I4_001546, partial [Neolewinella sp.]
LASVAFNPAQADHSNHADDDAGLYIGAGLARSDINTNQFDEAENELGLRAGYMLNDTFGVDITTASLGSTTVDGFDIDVGAIALSAIGSIPVGEAIDVYGKLGAARIVVEVSKGSQSAIDTSDTELFWGVGGEVDLGVTNVFVEYNRFDAEQADVNTLVAGLKFEF